MHLSTSIRFKTVISENLALMSFYAITKRCYAYIVKHDSYTKITLYYIFQIFYCSI